MWYFEEVLWHFNLILHEGGGGGGMAGESVQEKIFVWLSFKVYARVN